jgi:phosphatidate cytidylyltransferase
VVSYGGILAIVLANWVPWVVHAQDVMSHLAWPFAAMVIANAWVLLREAWIFRAPGSAVTTLGAGMFINFYLGVLATFFIELRWVEHGLMALACHIGAAKCGDIAAYFGGRAFGRHKLSPWLSPNKTVEGAVSGAAGSVLAVLVVVAIGARLMNVETLRFGTAVLFGLAIGIAGQVGDLVESLIKRDCQQKDASDLVPGFGGMLDVLDSPLFSAPLAFLLWIVLGPGWGGGL